MPGATAALAGLSVVAGAVVVALPGAAVDGAVLAGATVVVVVVLEGTVVVVVDGAVVVVGVVRGKYVEERRGEQPVRRVLTGVGDRVRGGVGDELGLDDFGRGVGPTLEESGRGTGNVRGRDRRAAHRRAGSSRRRDLDSGREEIDTRAEVRERRACVGWVGRRDGDDFGNARGRGQTGIRIVVTGRGDHNDAACDRLVHGAVERVRRRGDRAHDRDRGPDRVRGDPVDSAEELGDTGVTRAREYADRHEGDAGCRAARGTTQSRGDVGSVVVARGVRVRDGVHSRLDAVVELGGVSSDSAVDHIGVHADTRGGVAVGAVERKALLVETIESPRDRIGCGRRAHPPVFLDQCDTRILRQDRRSLR